MWAWPGLLLALTLLHVGGAESEGAGPRCQAPPTWKIGEVDPMQEAMGKVTVVALFQASWLFCLVQAGRMDSLRQKLESQGLRDVVYMVINHQGAQAQRLHPLLAEKLSANVTLYKQPEDQPDVWQILNGEKDDFFIYDRCGRLTQRITLPYSIIEHGHVEKAIRDAYCARSCGDCTHESTEIPEECRERPTEAAPTADPQHHPHHHHHHQHHPHHDHHHHHHHALGRHDGHEHHHGNHQQQQQQQLDLTQQQAQVDGQVVMHRPWAAEKAKWKSKHSWQWAPESENDVAPKASWCWHWRRLLFGGEEGAGLVAGGDEPAVGQWRCEEALPASWQWHGLSGGGGGHLGTVTETWQWRAPPAEWPQPQPAAAPWAWPPNAQSWDWQQV